MDDMDIEDASDNVGIDEIISLFSFLKKSFSNVLTQFRKLSEMFQSFVGIYNSIQERREPINEPSFLSIIGGLLVIVERLSVIEKKLGLIEQKVRFLDAVLDLTTENLIAMFSHPADEVVELIAEVYAEMLEILEKLTDVIEICRSILRMDES